ncbi:MAG TPA: tetratricopeptide repeat protein [Candidatus Binatia bacterium]|nr:tetratricopeptide repeat protein [Candidatus Binatia bacterium]
MNQTLLLPGLNPFPALARLWSYTRLPSLAGVPVLVAGITFGVFAPSLWHGFVNWDDTANFVENRHYRGLGWVNIRWMATTFLMGQWIPLTWLTLGLDYVLWGMDPFGYHLTNILLHCATAVALYFLSRRLIALSIPFREGDALTIAALASTLFFAIHPLRAESVAWVTERRDVLSGLFFVLALLGYLRARSGGPRSGAWLLASLGCYLLAALAKSIVATLPVVLLLLDLYPLRRIKPGDWRTRTGIRLVLEKAPYFAIALSTGLMAIWAQRSNNFLTSLDRLSVADRIIVAIYSVWFYFAKTVLPSSLSPLYELPARVELSEPRFLGSAVGTLVLSTIVLATGRRHPAVLVAWLAYLVILAPVNGLLHNGHQLTHDRYSYLSCLPLALMFGAGVGRVLQAGRGNLLRPAVARAALVTAAAWLVALGILTAQQVGIWRDDDTLWRHALESDPACSICHINLGITLANQGLPGLAIGQFERALALRPDRVRTHGNIGTTLLQAGRPADALARFQKVLARYPDDNNTRNNVAVCLLQLGRRDEALAELRAILERDPRHVLARANLGVALVEDHRLEEGTALLEEVLADKQDQAQARAGLVRGYLALNRNDAALSALEALRATDPRAANQLEGLLIPTW